MSDTDEWVRWSEGFQPPATIGKTVEVRYRSGKKWAGSADRVKWRKFDLPIDVCYYRLTPSAGEVESNTDEWIKWKGGMCPVPEGTMVEYQMRSGGFSSAPADGLNWGWTLLGADFDIVAYRVVGEAPKAAESTDSITAVLTERGSRYGPFTGHAEVTQRLKEVIGAALRQRNKTLTPDQQEALDMICHKIGRIINGDPNYADSWVDIAGYAKLVADRLQGVVR